MKFRGWLALVAIALAAVPAASAALGRESLLAATVVPGAVTLAAENGAAPIVVADEDWPGVRRAATDLQADIERVSGQKPRLG